ncbi:hypothetical protein [Paraburkholderia sprentiae]|uniref:hypothetical protein n=1 Tax=Paraburkholderia sprentiae TaxID=948107 RepID=UPI0004839783|nr:hypothetical protein [Paraburkholderia sprentiae]
MPLLPPVLPEPNPPGPELAELFPPPLLAPAPVDDVPLPDGDPVDPVEPSAAAATPKPPPDPNSPPTCGVQPGLPLHGHSPCASTSASTITPEFVAGATVLAEFVCAPAIAA